MMNFKYKHIFTNLIIYFIVKYKKIRAEVCFMELNAEKIIFDSVKKKVFTVNVAGKEIVNSASKILSVTAHSCCGRSEIVNNELIIEGIVKYCAIIKEDEVVKKIIKSERFSLNEYSNEFKTESKLITFSSVDKVRAYIEAGNIMFSSTVNVSAIIIENNEIECISSFDDDFRKKEQEVSFLKNTFNEQIRFNVNDETELSPRLPEIKEILSVNTSINVKEAHISAGQLIFGGEISLQTVYYSVDEYEPIIQISDKFDFSQLIDLDCMTDSEPYVILNVDDVNANIKINEQNEMRIIQYAIELCGNVFAFDEIKCNVISDAYSVKNRIQCEKEQLKYSTIGKACNYTVSKNILVKVPENCNPISRVNSVTFSADMVDSEVLDSKIILKCVGKAGVIYTASNSGETEGFDSNIEFELVIEKNNMENTQNIICYMSISDMQAVLISGDKVEIHAMFYVKAIPEYIVDNTLVTDISVLEESDFPEYGIIIYVTKQGDTLWDVSKKFGVDEEEILKLNEGISDILEPEKKIFVFRKLVI